MFRDRISGNELRSLIQFYSPHSLKTPFERDFTLTQWMDHLDGFPSSASFVTICSLCLCWWVSPSSRLFVWYFCCALQNYNPWTCLRQCDSISAKYSHEGIIDPSPRISCPIHWPQPQYNIYLLSSTSVEPYLTATTAAVDDLQPPQQLLDGDCEREMVPDKNRHRSAK